MSEGMSGPDFSEIAEIEAAEKLRDIEKVAKIKAATVKEALLLVDKLRKRQDLEGDTSALRHDWVDKAVKGALEKLEESKEPFTIVTDGTESQREGIPVDTLIASLLEGVDVDETTEFRAKDLQNGILRDEILRDVLHPYSRLQNERIEDVDAKEAAVASHIDWILEKIGDGIAPDDRRRMELARDLISASERYFDLDRDSSRVTPETNRRDANHWRTKLEAYYVSQPEDYRCHETEDKDYVRIAMNYLNCRREVFIQPDDTSKKESEQTTAIEPAKPDTTYTKSGDQLTDPKLEIDKPTTRYSKKRKDLVDPITLVGKPDSSYSKSGDQLADPKLVVENSNKPEEQDLESDGDGLDDKMIRYQENEDEKMIVIDGGEEEPHPHPELDDGATPPIEPAPVHEKEKIILADASEIAKAMAWRIAENRLNEIIKYDSGPAPRGFWGKMWKGAKMPFTREFWGSQFAKLGEQGYLNKFYREALAEIENNQDLLTDIRGRLLGDSETMTRSGTEKNEHYRMLDAVVREVQEQVIEADERGSDVIGGGAIFGDLINRHLAGEFADRNAFEAAAREVIQAALDNGTLNRNQFSTEGREADADGVLYASNLYEVAERYRDRAIAEVGELADGEMTPEQKEKLQGIMSGIGNLDLQLATKFQDLNESRARRPDGRGGNLSMWEKAASWARSRPILGVLINPTTAGIATGFATRGALRKTALFGAGAVGGAAVLGTFGLPLVVGAAMAGTFAYINRRRNLSFDRGMEQRREVVGLQGEGRRAERIREFGFSGIAREATELRQGIEAGREADLLEATALYEAERQLRDAGRPVDLIWAGEAEGEQNGSNIVSKVDLKVAVRDASAGITDPAWADRVNNRVADIIERVRQQDAQFERYRVREGLKAAAFTAITAGVAGAAAQEVGHQIQGYFNPEEAARRVTLLDYVAGKRPAVESFRAGEALYSSDQIQTAPDGSRFVDVPLKDAMGTTEPGSLHYIINPDGSTVLDRANSQLASGYSFNENGEIDHLVSKGVEGGPLNAESWDKLREYATSQHPDTFGQTQAHWAKFYENQHYPVGNSYEPGYIANAEGTELQMDFHHGTGGFSVDLGRMSGHTAFGSGGEFRIDHNTPMLITIGLREHALSHQVLTMEISPGKPAVFPDDIGKQIFEVHNGEVVLKPGVMITADRVLGNVNGVGQGDATNLGHVAADYRTGVGQVEASPDVVEIFSAPDAYYNPPKVIDGPIPLPFDNRRAIENPAKKDKDSDDEPGPNGPVAPTPPTYTGEGESTPPPVPPTYTEGSGDTPPNLPPAGSTERTGQLPPTPLVAPSQPLPPTSQAQSLPSSSELAKEGEGTSQTQEPPRDTSQAPNTPPRPDRDSDGGNGGAVAEAPVNGEQDERRREREMVAAADQFETILNMDSFQQRKDALLAQRQSFIDRGVFNANEAVLRIDGTNVRYEDLREEQDEKIKEALRVLSTDLRRPAAARVNRQRNRRIPANENMRQAA